MPVMRKSEPARRALASSVIEKGSCLITMFTAWLGMLSVAEPRMRLFLSGRGLSMLAGTSVAVSLGPSCSVWAVAKNDMAMFSDGPERHGDELSCIIGVVPTW